MKRYPEENLAVSGNYYLGLAYFQLGRYERAFEHFGSYAAAAVSEEERKWARRLQLESLERWGVRKITAAQPHFESLASEVRYENIAADARRTLADLLYEQNRYHRAQDAYLDFIDYHPMRRDVPDAWFRVASCYYNIALRAGRGRLHLSEAAIALEDFLFNFSTHPNAGEAEDMLDEILNLKADKLAEIAAFYHDVRNNPGAAIECLRELIENFPDTDAAGFASERIEEIRLKYNRAPAGEYVILPLDGVVLSGEQVEDISGGQ